MKRINLKPLTVNQAWKGRRFSTKAKTAYEEKLTEALQGTELEAVAPFLIYFRFHIGKTSDWDNAVKVTQDTICKFYGINDRDIYKAIIEKIPTKKGEEYFEVEIETLIL